jgi:hypothetical protein
LIEADFPLVGETLDKFEENGVISTYAPKLRPTKPWRNQIMEGWVIISVYYWQPRDFRCILSREGQVNIYGPGGQPDHTYQIPEAGVWTEDAAGLGYVNRIRAIGDHLYVCGQSRQVYRFDWDGKDLASGQWLDVAGPMRQPPMPEPPDDADEGAFNRWLDDNDAIDLVDIDGPSEDDIYAVGDEVWHWDGQHWAQITLPTDEPLSALKVMNSNEIYLVGRNGALLRGNRRDGFVDLSSVEDNQRFVGIEYFDGKLFLASNLGLFVYDPNERKIERHSTNLKPDLQDTHVLEAKDGILWSFGFKDLAWFDGQTWTRVDHPDNPPIR